MPSIDRDYPRRAAFIPIGAAFIAIGASGQTAFIGVGALFLVVGLSAMRRHHETEAREGDDAQMPPSC